MEPFSFAAGVGVLCIVSLDLIAVTIGLSTRRTLTGLVARGVFDLIRRMAAVVPERMLAAVSGALVMIAVASVWIAGTWLGWSLVFASVPGSIEEDRTGLVPEGYDYAAHTGQLLSTLGGGQTSAGGPIWALTSVLVGVNGMVVLTLSVSFLLSVRQTVQAGRSFAMLQAVGACAPGDAQEDLARLVAGLHAAPFALWYGHERAARQLPVALVAHAEDARRAGGDVWERTWTILADLPHLDADAGGDRLERLWRWADRHTVIRLSDPAARVARG